MKKSELIVGVAIGLLSIVILIGTQFKTDDSELKCDVFKATVNNSGEEMAKVSIKDDRFVDGTKVEVKICGESYKIKPLDE